VDNPWIQEKWPDTLIPNDPAATKVMRANQMRPIQRCRKSPFRRDKITAPRGKANPAAIACADISGVKCVVGMSALTIKNTFQQRT
jgi:hypothetical protein